MNSTVQQCVKTLKAMRPQHRPRLAIILGSGLAALADQLSEVVRFDYETLPGFAPSTVAGHPGQLILGRLGEADIICLQGRAHYYEGHDNEVFLTPIRTLKALGCSAVLMTNAVGSLHKHLEPGQWVLIRDHINLSGYNPLVGVNDDSVGPRFPSMVDAYDPAFRTQLKAAAAAQRLSVKEGVYVGVLGPSYETPAEIQAFRRLGGDVVGMSTVPEVICARHCGLRVATLSVVSNYAAGLSDTPITHEHALEMAARAANDCLALIACWISTHFTLT